MKCLRVLNTLTKRFVKDDLNDDFEDSLDELEPLASDSYIVRLNFTGDNATEPIVSYITKTHNIDVNILKLTSRILEMVL